MKTIELTGMQRIRLENLLDVQTGRRRSELQIFDDIRTKVELSEEEREAVSWRDHPGGGFEFNPEKAAGLPRKSVQIEKAEGSALRDLLDSWPNFVTRDKRLWLDDLWAQLK